MLNRLPGFTAMTAVALVLSVASGADPKSGPQVGDEVHGFQPLNCTGDHVGDHIRDRLIRADRLTKGGALFRIRRCRLAARPR